MGFKCGIVGLPNVGKSTLFNALTKANIEAANYPFCTIEPNVGVVAVPDQRLQELASIVNPQKILPTTMEFVDIAGLVAGASKGEGLGNKFLSHIRETDAIAHVVRCFEDENVVHVAGKTNPLDDIEVINTELLLADMELIEKAISKLRKNARSGDKESTRKCELLSQLQDHLDNGQSIRAFNFADSDLELIKEWQFITIKPIMYIANLDEEYNSDNERLKAVVNYAAKEDSLVVPISGTIEEEIAQLDEAEKLEFIAELGLEESGLDRLIRVGYQLLQLQTYFTAGKKEVRAWTIPQGSTAPQAAGKIHSDFEKGFIRAEIISYEDYINNSGELKAKENGKMRLEGKDYIVQEGDVIHFRFNV